MKTKQFIYTLLIAAIAFTAASCEKDSPAPEEDKTVAVYYSLATPPGEIYALINGQEHVSGAKVEIGTRIEFTAIPPKDHEVTAWTVNDQEVAKSVNTYTLMVEKEATVKVAFAKLSYKLSADGKTLLKWIGTEEVIDMNADPKLKNVTSIAKEAFEENKHVKVIKTGKSVASIGRLGFWNCSNLTSVELNEGLKIIGTGAFGLTAITTIHFPSTVEAIGESKSQDDGGYGSAFTTAYELTSFTVASANKKYKATDGVLYSKDGKTLVTYPHKKNATKFSVPEGVTTLGYCSMLRQAALKYLILPTTLTWMEESSLYSVNLEWLQLKTNTPPTPDGGLSKVFGSSGHMNTTLYVYTAAVNAYKKAGWNSYFKEIKTP